MKKLRVWWIPQVPGPTFEVNVNSIAEGVKVMDVLAQYDMFQYKNRIKPDYANAGGIMQWDAQHCEWEDWYDEVTGIDDPREYLEPSWLKKDNG